MAILVLISLFLASPMSAFIWQYSPLPKLVQFPWRFLALTAFALAVLAGRLPRKVGIIAAVLIILSATPFLKVNQTFHPEGYYTTNDDTTTVQNEYMPKGVKIDPVNRPSTPATVYFPGVKVIVAGREIEPEIDDNGIVKTPGPIVFRETPLRLVADLASLFGLLLWAILLIRSWGFEKH